MVQLLPALVEGGVERGVVESNREYVKRGVESFVISSGGRLAKQIEADGGVHITFDLKSKNPLSAPWRVMELRKLLRKIAPDIIHARSRVPAWLGYFAKGSTPFVTTVHGFNSVNLYSSIMTRGDRVICVSNPIKKYILRHYKVDEDKIRVIHRGVDLKVFDPQRIDTAFIEEFKRRWDLEGRFVVAAVGRITQLKGYEIFIEAMATVRRHNPEAIGIVAGGVQAGKEDYFQKILALNRSFGEPVRFVGSQQKIAEIYALSDILVSSSKKPESFGRSLVEAMAMETPVVAPAFGGALDIVAPGTGALFEPGSSLDLAQKIIGLKVTKDLRSYVQEHFSLEVMIQKSLELYEELV